MIVSFDRVGSAAMGARPGAISAVVFDLGGVLIDWDPRYLYRTLFDDDEAAMEDFLDRHDAGVEPRRTRAGRGPRRSRS